MLGLLEITLSRWICERKSIVTYNLFIFQGSVKVGSKTALLKYIQPDRNAKEPVRFSFIV